MQGHVQDAPASRERSGARAEPEAKHLIPERFIKHEFYDEINMINNKIMKMGVNCSLPTKWLHTCQLFLFNQNFLNFFFQEKGAIFFVRSFFCDYLLTVKHMKYMNVPFFENFTPICSFLLGFKVGRYVIGIPQTQCAYTYAIGIALSINPATPDAATKSKTSKTKWWRPEAESLFKTL